MNSIAVRADLMRWLADLRRRLVSEPRQVRDDDLVRLVVTPLEERRVLSVTGVDAGADQIVDEGATVDLDDATYTESDPTGNSPHEATIDWGDGQTSTVPASPPGSDGIGGIPATHTYADDGVYQLNVTVTGSDGTWASGTDTTITVGNVAPTIESLILSADTIIEGDTVTLEVTFADPGVADLHTIDVDWGDSSTSRINLDGPRTATLSHQYTDDDPSVTGSDTYDIQVTVSDDDGGSDSGSTSVTVLNEAPAVTPSAYDLTGWAPENFSGGSSWSVDGSGTSVTQGGNSQPTVFLSDDATSFGLFEATVEVVGNSDDDFIGFVIGFQPGDFGDSSADYLLIDWKMRTQTYSGHTGQAGLSVSRVTGAAATEFDFWDHSGTVTELARATTLGSQGWQRGIEYRFTIDYSAESLRVYVNGVPEIDIAAPTATPLPAGRFGFYNYSQNAVRYAANESLIVAGQEGVAVTITRDFEDPGVDDSFAVLFNWGDGTMSPGSVTFAAGIGTLTGTHHYADDGRYLISYGLADDDSGLTAGIGIAEITNVPPTLIVVGNQTIDEGALLSLTDLGTFTDPGFGPVETFTYSIDWGDGSAPDNGVPTIDTPGSPGTPTAGSFDGSHTYADDGTYTVMVTVRDDNGGEDVETFLVSVENVNPTLAVVGDQTINEGALLSLTDLGTFTDPGFGPVETFTYSINWGDGTASDNGSPMIDTPGSPGTPTAGSFDGSHTYADDGAYTVTVTIRDDNSGVDVETFLVSVENVVPRVDGVTGDEQVDEGETFTLADLGWAIADPGFDNPANPGGATSETFTSSYTVDWGDGTPTETGAILDRVSGSPGVATIAQFEEIPHTYADNGVYTIRLTFGDDDSAPVEYALRIVVNNVAPTVVPIGPQTIDEGALLNLIDIATFTDPGFDNPLRPGGPSVETFHYDIDWGDGSSIDSGDTTIDLAGSAGVATAGSFDGSHTFADDGLYTVTLTVTDDDGGTTAVTTQVHVRNVNPTILHFDDSEMDGAGVVTIEGDFSDPGYDNPLNPLQPPDGSRESFAVVIDWGDGTFDTIPLGGPGPFHFTSSHFYDGPVNPANPAADIPIVATVIDDDGGTDTAVTYAEVPGEGVEYVYIDTTPKVPRLVFPRAPRMDSGDAGAGSSEFFLASAEFETARPDSTVASENYIVLRKVLPDGTEGPDHRLPDDALDKLPRILSRLPDNRYRIYEMQSDGPDRLVRDVFVRQHRVIDQTDASEGIEERPPQSRRIEPNDPAPAPDAAVAHPPGDHWEQWETLHATESATDGSQPEGPSREAPSEATTAVAGTALLAFRLRAGRNQSIDDAMRRFAEPNPDAGRGLPRKPR